MTEEKNHYESMDAKELAEEISEDFDPFQEIFLASVDDEKVDTIHSKYPDWLKTHSRLLNKQMKYTSHFAEVSLSAALAIFLYTSFGVASVIGMLFVWHLIDFMAFKFIGNPRQKSIEKMINRMEDK